MNISVGMMMPLMNWAPKPAAYRSSFLVSNSSSVSRLRPNTLTSPWPVKVSSTTALSSPVLFHCWMNFFCERFPIIAVTNTDSGMVTRAMRASSGEMTNIIVTMATTVSSEVTSWLSVCCRLWAMLSMSLVTRLSSSPRGWLSK